MNTENDSTDDVAEILQRFQALIEDDLSEEDIEARLKTEFTEDEQKIISETFLSLIEAGETDRHFPLDA